MNTTTVACAANRTAQIPPEYVTPNFNFQACSVPVCGNNTAILTACRGTAKEPCRSFNVTQDGRKELYMSCTGPKIGRDIQEYQDCLLRQGATVFKCNGQLRSKFDTQCVALDIPNRAGWNLSEGQQACAGRVNPNVTSLFARCCKDSGSEPISIDNGCQQYCTGMGNTLRDCLEPARSEFDVACSGDTDNPNAAGVSYIRYVPLATTWLIVTLVTMAVLV